LLFCDVALLGSPSKLPLQPPFLGFVVKTAQLRRRFAVPEVAGSSHAAPTMLAGQGQFSDLTVFNLKTP
jgi:hypothetical protein